MLESSSMKTKYINTVKQVEKAGVCRPTSIKTPVNIHDG